MRGTLKNTHHTHLRAHTHLEGIAVSRHSAAELGQVDEVSAAVHHMTLDVAELGGAHKHRRWAAAGNGSWFLARPVTRRAITGRNMTRRGDLARRCSLSTCINYIYLPLSRRIQSNLGHLQGSKVT